ncbi:MAG: citrate lyase subunit alpha [Thermoproteales archaeon]|nr:citrate lyase subunit alpha [Thermoproteales archaeon]
MPDILSILPEQNDKSLHNILINPFVFPFMLNAAGREIPEEISGRKLKPYKGLFSFKPKGRYYAKPLKAVFPGETKILPSIKEAIKKTGLQDGMTISFHHHMRNGDAVVNMVVDEIARMGIKHIKLAPTALFPVHEPLIEHIKKGVVSSIEGSLNGPVGEYVSRNGLEEPVMIRSHGGRARAVRSGDLHVDVAFLAASMADEYGNCNGMLGQSAFGAMGFAVADSLHADHVVVITDNLQPYPVSPTTISQIWVDYVVEVESIGDPSGIQTGTMRITKSPSRLTIARNVVKFLDKAGVLEDGFSFQAGAGGISLAVTKFIHEYMKKNGMVGDFVMGGITGFVVDMLEDGTIKKILDGQSFDLKAVESIARNPDHVEVSHIEFGDPHTCGCVVNRQHACFLGATEIDLNFNVNVNTHSDGLLLHGIGGHQDAAASSDVTVVTAPLLRGRVPVIREEVTTISTPGEAVDVVATDAGIAVNPARDDLIEAVKGKMEIVEIEELYKKATRLVGKPESPQCTDDIIAIVEYRDGTVLDVVRKVK